MSLLENVLRQGVEILWSPHFDIHRIFNTLAKLLQYLFVVHDNSLYQVSLPFCKLCDAKLQLFLQFQSTCHIK